MMKEQKVAFEEVENALGDLIQILNQMRTRYGKEAVGIALVEALAEHVAHFSDNEEILKDGMDLFTSLFRANCPKYYQENQKKKRIIN